jgi:hypothetical protein
MERNFTNENMEEFLQQNAEGLRMRPSGRVWKAIANHLNRRRRRVGFLLGTSLLLTTALGYYLVNESAKNFHRSTVIPNSKTERAVSKQISALTDGNKEFVGTTNSSIKDSRKVLYQTPAKNGKASVLETLAVLNTETLQNVFSPTIVDSYFEKESDVDNKLPTQKEISVTDPLSIESILNIYKPKSRKLTWQTYFTPTVSYRKLNDNYIDNVVPHKPAFGFELGMAAKYPVSKNTKLRAGLQFNVNRYEIKTYDSYSQLATIRLNDRNGVDYVRTITNYNNFSGYKSNWLQNFYFQVSAPVGIELKIKGDDKMQFGIASTLQPTYLLGDKTYVISADYKNYAEMPKLVRRWNVNTNLETFVAYSTGHLNWQVGPQVRYQILSSYVKKYPVKENLFDFGLKVGISFNRQ